jgi:hypothetical protein
VQLEIDFDRYPAARFGDTRFDVPLNRPLGRQKKALRNLLRGFEQVEAAHLLICSDPAWGNTAEPVVVVAPQANTQELLSAWKPYVAEFGDVGFDVLNSVFSPFVAHASTPFYCPRETAKIPAPLSRAELIEYVRTLPDDLGLEATAVYLEAHKENYDHLPPEEAAERRKAQQTWIEDTLHWLGMLRSPSAAAKAKSEWLRYLTEDIRFSLALRTFSAFTTAGVGPLGTSRMWMYSRPSAELVSQFSPLPLIGIANPLDPLPLANVPLLECSERWLEVVMSALAVATQVFVQCDRVSSGVSSEFFAIQAAEREDDTMIVLPGPEQEDHYRQLYRGMEKRIEDLGPEYAPALQRKLATFGLTITTGEMSSLLRGGKLQKTDAAGSGND